MVEVYLDLVVLLNFLVDLLLLLGTNRLAGYPPGLGRAALAAALGGIYGGACLLPGFRFLGNTLWRVVSLGLMGVLAFGTGSGTVRRCTLFVLLSMALGGIAGGLGSGSFWSLVPAAAGVCGLCLVGFRGRADGGKYIPVTLYHNGRRVEMTALHDTGNTLRDPVTGDRVLVAGAEAARYLAGLTPEELSAPVETMASGRVPGLRLIPYRAVGQSQGMLLGLRISKAKVGKREMGLTVAFAPAGLGNGSGEFEALIGGMV